jgi:hypothetical protein
MQICSFKGEKVPFNCEEKETSIIFQFVREIIVDFSLIVACVLIVQYTGQETYA